MPRSDQRISYYNGSYTRIELQAAARGLDAGRQDRSVVLWAKRGKETCTLYEQKSPVSIQILSAYTAIGDAETQSPGMLRKPGDLPQVCPRPKTFLTGLPRATHGTDRAQTSGNVSPTVELCPPHPTFRTKVRARRDVTEGNKKITNIHIHMAPIFQK